MTPITKEIPTAGKSLQKRSDHEHGNQSATVSGRVGGRRRAAGPG
jgi:hypothetical protein